jgi:hypothetical protein
MGICPTPIGQWTLNWKYGGYNESRTHKKQRKNAEHTGNYHIYKETVAGNQINGKQTSKSNKIFETVLKHDPKNDNTDEHPHKLLSRVKPTTPARRRIYHKGMEEIGRAHV